MEADGQWIAHARPCALFITLHVIFLATDVGNNMLCRRSVQTEISAPVAINLRKIITWLGSLTSHRITGNGDRLEHWIAQQRQHLVSIAPAKLTIAGGVEMEIVRTVGASF